MSNHHIKRPLALVLYRVFGWPLLRAVFSLLSFFIPKIRLGLEMRKGSPWLKFSRATERPTIWFHCASGEFEYAKPVITRLAKNENAKWRIIVTYFSPTYAHAVEKFPGVDECFPLPWDTPQALGEFLNKQNPKALLIARTDTWPEMLYQTQVRRIPSLLFAATLSPLSGRVRNPLARAISKAVFSSLTSIYGVSAEDQRAFEALGLSTPVTVAGDTRYDQTIERLKSPKPIKQELFDGRSRARTLIAGSTWAEDESVLIEAATHLQGLDFNLVLVPHEPTPEHVASLRAQLNNLGLRSALYSEPLWPKDSILIVDRVGLLAELYLQSDLAFVGGSFRKTVHSVMEPLAAGALTFVGPLYKNNREAIEFAELGYVRVVRDATELAEELETALSRDDVEVERVRLTIQKEIESRSGKSDLVISWVAQTTTS